MFRRSALLGVKRGKAVRSRHREVSSHRRGAALDHDSFRQVTFADSLDSFGARPPLTPA